MTKLIRIVDVLLGSIVVALVGWTGVGATAGGWIAGRRTSGPARGALAAGVAGLVGAAPWAALVYLASSGAIDPVGYHESVVHVGVNPADPSLLSLWQEAALTGLVAAILVTGAVAGGLLASGSAKIVEEIRANGSSPQ